MHRVEIKYDLNLLGIRLPRTLRRDVPECWDELTEKQLDGVMELLYMPLEERQRQLLCLKVLFNVRFGLFFGMSVEDVDACLWLTYFIFDNITLTKNKKPIIYAKRGEYYGPVDGLKSISAAEFMDSDRYFMNYLKASDLRKAGKDRTKVLVDGHDADHWLDMFVAVLYRPMDVAKYAKWKKVNMRGWVLKKKKRKVDVDVRVDFDQDTVAARKVVMQQLSKASKLGILNGYRSCRNVWERALPNVFSGDNKSKAADYGWFEVMKNVSSADFGTLEQKERVPMFTIFLSMEVDIKNEKERERRMKKAG